MSLQLEVMKTFEREKEGPLTFESPPAGLNTLPVELVQEITEYLPQSDILNSMLISKYLRECCLHQAPRAFYALRVDSDKVEEWINGPVDGDEDFRKSWMDYARSLYCTIGLEATTTTHEHYRVFFARLNGFKNLTSLRLTSVALNFPITIPEVNVKDLTLESCDINLDTFATLVKSLPKITHLILIKFHSGDRRQLRCGFPRSLKNLSFVKLSHQTGNLINMFVQVPLDEVSISWGENESTERYQRVIEAVGAKVKILDLQGNLRIFQEDFHLQSCTNLRELKMGNCPYRREIRIIKTITSMKIRRVVFTRLDVLRDPAHELKLDHGLCELVNQPGYNGRLEVVFRGAYDDSGVVFEDFLPNLRKCERAEVKFIDVEGNIIHSLGKAQHSCS